MVLSAVGQAGGREGRSGCRRLPQAWRRVSQMAGGHAGRLGRNGGRAAVFPGAPGGCGPARVIRQGAQSAACPDQALFDPNPKNLHVVRKIQMSPLAPAGPAGGGAARAPAFSISRQSRVSPSIRRQAAPDRPGKECGAAGRCQVHRPECRVRLASLNLVALQVRRRWAGYAGGTRLCGRASPRTGFQTVVRLDLSRKNRARNGLRSAADHFI